MTVDELVQRMEAAPIGLAFDTNFLFAANSQTALTDVAEKVNQANERLRPGSKRGPITVYLPALVHAERAYQIRRSRAARAQSFDLSYIRESLEDLGFEFVPFEQPDAEGAVEHLFALYPDDDSWHAAKKSKGSTSATVDWYIAGQAAHRGWLVVTDDGGPEWQGLPKVKRATLLAALDRITAERAP